MVHKLVVAGAKVLLSDKKTQYLPKNYKQLHGIAEWGATATETHDVEPLVSGYEEPQPPTTAGMAPPKTASRTEPVAADEGLAEGSTSNTRVASLQQTSISRWVDNDAQKKLDIAWAEAMFRVGIAFNFLNFDTTQKLHEVYLEVANARPKVKLPSYKHMRTVMLDFIYLRIQKWMDRDGTSPTNLVEYDDLIERKVAHVVLTDEQRANVMEKAKDWVKMMRQPVHALAFLLDPRRRNPRWLYGRDSAIVQNVMLYLQRQVGGDWKGSDHLEVLSDLHEFHKEPTPNGPRRKDKKMREPDAKVDCEKLTPSEWWATYGGDVLDVQAIAIKVMGMWSTATPTERNWASMDFVHSKRRNSLKPETLEKLVYIHWNMQLLRAANNSGANGEGYVDLWSSFFEAIPEPDENNGSVLRGPEEETEKTDEELVPQSSFVKTRKGRIPKKLEDEEDECTDDGDLDDELWKGRGGLSDETSGAEEEEDETIPTWREIERRKKKVGEKEPEKRRPLDAVQEREEEEQQQSGPILKEADQQEADHRKEADQQEADQQETEHRKEVEEKDQQEDKGDMDHAQEPEMEHGKKDEGWSMKRTRRGWRTYCVPFIGTTATPRPDPPPPEPSVPTPSPSITVTSPRQFAHFIRQDDVIFFMVDVTDLLHYDPPCPDAELIPLEPDPHSISMAPTSTFVPPPSIESTPPSRADADVEELARYTADLEPAVRDLIREYHDVFPSFFSYTGIPPMRDVEHSIQLVPDYRVHHQAPYRLSIPEATELKRQLEGLLRLGFIKPSNSPWGAPVLFARKADGTLRLCIDYRGLNRYTVKNNYPMPRYDELFDRLAGNRFFTKIDLRSGYHQIRVAAADEPKAAFRSRLGHFTVMPFGLTNATATFQRAMNDIFRDILKQYVLVYLNDILVYSRTLEEQLRHLSDVLDRLRRHGFYAKLSKCRFAQHKVDFLGHYVSDQGLHMDDAKITAIAEWPAPTSAKQLRSFLGLTSYYSDCPIAFYSRQLLPAEINYTADEREVLAVVYAARHWCHYVHGAPFTVRTDNSVVEAFLTKPKLTPRQARWWRDLSEFSFTTEHIKGETNRVADALSRRPDHDHEHIQLSSISVTTVHHSVIDEFRTMYLHCLDYRDIHAARRSGKIVPNYSLGDNGLVYWHGSQGTREPRICVPSTGQLRIRAVAEFHDQAAAGHMGFHKKLARVSRLYVWPKRKDFVKDYVAECPTCQEVNSANHLPYGLPQPLPIPKGRWQSISMDFIGPLRPPTPRGHDAILVVVDRFTKRACFVPCRYAISAREVADIVFDRVAPRRYHSSAYFDVLEIRYDFILGTPWSRRFCSTEAEWATKTLVLKTKCSQTHRVPFIGTTGDIPPDLPPQDPRPSRSHPDIAFTSPRQFAHFIRHKDVTFYSVNVMDLLRYDPLCPEVELMSLEPDPPDPSFIFVAPISTSTRQPTDTPSTSQASAISTVESTHTFRADADIEELTRFTTDLEPAVRDLIREYHDVFPPYFSYSGIPLMRGVEHSIQLVPHYRVHHQAPYRLSIPEAMELKRQLEELLRLGFIKPSNSSWGAPVLFARKADGTLRLCSDYRGVNRYTVKNNYPMPRADESFNHFAGNRFFTKIDLRSGYHQIRVAAEDRSKTAFRSHFGHYEFTVMPFGLTNAPATFETAMNDIFRDILKEYLLVYLNDILVYSRTLEDHIRYLRDVLQRLRKHDFYAKLSKCRFAQRKVDFLGHHVFDQGIHMDDAKITPIVEWPVPTYVKQLRSFLGLTSYYSNFIQGYARYSYVLTSTLHLDVYKRQIIHRVKAQC
ncbi:hypothetical protein CBR_g4717 [Chara braunii]|uniref:Reverse transcriptase domain-containing protein n=1 Tax=Chara braunii TaxID=69332 RepID=A0A388KIM6_CHABU|nr:hypothetical protein CBR_g4717 [Chara braunii]|eukprot:GBG69889.1 hypothetical protein CBR_g4717 [Chara braunii]